MCLQNPYEVHISLYKVSKAMRVDSKLAAVDLTVDLGPRTTELTIDIVKSE